MKKHFRAGLMALQLLSFLPAQAGIVELRSVTDFSNIIRSGAVVVYFYKPNCKFCTATNSVIPNVARQFPKVTFLKVNVAQFPGLKSFSTVPHLRCYKNGSAAFSISDSKGITVAHLTASLKRIFG